MNYFSTINRTGQRFARNGGHGHLGLSKVHISAQGEIRDKGMLLAYPEGSMMTIKRSVRFASSKPLGGLRGKIKGFSSASRRRLMRKIAMLRRDALPILVTLTYPADYPIDSREYKRHLDNFRRRMVRRFPGCGVVWRLEFQRRGAPHYHLLVWGVTYRQLLAWVPMAWYQTVASGDLKHLLAGTRVEMVRSYRGLWSYVSKYVAKVADADDLQVGRWWGYWGTLPLSASVLLVISDSDAIQLLRYARRYSGVRSRCWWSFTLFCLPDVWLRKLGLSPG